MRRANEDFGSAGAELVVVGNGAPHYVAGFRDKTGFDGPIYTDPELASYRALEFERGLGTTFNIRSLARAWKAYGAGNRQSKPISRPQGDAWQQGGVVAVEPGGSIVYRYGSRHAGDHPPVADILAAVRRTAG